MSMSFIQRMITGGQQLLGTQAQPAMAMVPVSTRQQQTTQGYNPFMAAMDRDSQQFKDMYGVNRPLAKPMFLGYRDNTALYGGSRLFILY